jgi:hypothetical protein
MIDDEDDFWSNWWNEIWQGKPKYSEKTYPGATLSTTKFHMTRSRTPDRSGGKPATNRLSYGATFFHGLIKHVFNIETIERWVMVWREAVVADICLEILMKATKTSVRTACIPAKIRTQQLLNRRKER